MALGRILQTVMLRPSLLARTLQLFARVPPLGKAVLAGTRDMGMVKDHAMVRVEKE